MYVTRSVSTSADPGVWMIVSFVLAIVGGIVAYFLFTSKKNNGEYKGFVAWLHSFLRFDKMMIEALLKIVYLVLTIFITLSSFGFISTSFLTFLLYLIVGNLVLRMVFELSILGIQLWKNTTEIKEIISEDKKSKK